MSRQPRHRTRSEIIPSILEVTNGNKVRITEIELKACLPYNIVKDYLAHLVQCGLIEYIDGGKGIQNYTKRRASNNHIPYDEGNVC
jgi:predicted transcriptional regulator